MIQTCHVVFFTSMCVVTLVSHAGLSLTKRYVIDWRVHFRYIYNIFECIFDGSLVMSENRLS